MQPTLEKPAFIINMAARKAQDETDIAVDSMRRKGIIGITPIAVEPASIPSAIHQARNQGATAIIIGGGDGTILAAVNTLAYSRIPMGVIPMGTTNNVARSLDIPLNITDAVSVISRGRVKRITLGNINGRYFTNIASIGISVETAQQTTAFSKRLWGKSAYTLTAAALFLRHQPFSCVLQPGDQSKLEIITHQLIIANGSYHAGRLLPFDTSISRNELVVIAFGRHKDRFRHAQNIVRIALGIQPNMEEAAVIKTSSLTITTNPAQDIELDGEVVTSTPATCVLARNALHVLC